MTGNASKYALIGGKEATLREAIPHAFTSEEVCVFEDGSGDRRFVSKEEWDTGAEEFARYASERHLVTSESPGRDKTWRDRGAIAALVAEMLPELPEPRKCRE